MAGDGSAEKAADTPPPSNLETSPPSKPTAAPAPSSPAEPPGLPSPAVSAKPGEWVAIFNGTDLTGWTKGEKSGQVAVQDGYVYRVSGASADILYALPANSVDISAEVYVGEKGNVDFKITAGTLVVEHPRRGLAPDQWHEILIEVRNGGIVKATIDGKDYGFDRDGAAPKGQLRLYFKGGETPERVRNIRLRP
jgi:hypothetical protein